MSNTPESIRGRFASAELDESAQNASRALREQYADVATRLAELLPQGRGLSTALTHLETSAMWAQKALSDTD